MERFFNWIHSILENMVWQSMLARIEWVDWFTLMFALFGILIGLKKGFFRMVVVCLEFFIILYFVFDFSSSLVQFIYGKIHGLPQVWAQVTGFIITAAPIAILVCVIDGKLSKWFHTDIPKGLRAVGGFGFGLILGFFFWSFISQPLILGLPAPIKRAYDPGASYTGEFMANLAPQSYVFLRSFIAPEKKDKKE